MERRTPTDISDYWQIFLRRKWWIAIPAIVIAVLVFFVSFKLPKYYRSETLILVDPQKVPAEYVKATVSGDVSDRLQTIGQEILSRTRLQKIIDQFGLYKDRSFLPQEDIIELMRKDIQVDVESDQNASNRQKNSVAFRISYSGRDPALVQQVTRQISSLFIEENLKVREQQAEGTTEFIQSELEKSRALLEAQELRIKAFKARYMGSLPEQQQANLQVLGQFQAMMQANSDAIGRAQQQKTYLASMLEAVSDKPLPAPQASLRNELNQRRAELVSAEQKYKPEHPDVIRLKNEVAALEIKAKTLADSEALAPSSDQPAQLRGQIGALEQELKDRNRRQAEMENKMRSLQARIEVLPAIEQQFAEINRDYETSKADYQSLLAKKNSSAMAAEMERRAKGEQFRILDPASFPEKPYKPNLLQFNLLGLLGGLMAGCALGAGIEYRDRSLHTEKDLAHYISFPVLGSLPKIETKESMRETKKRRRLAIVFGSVAAALLVFTLLYLYKTTHFVDLRGAF